MKKNKLILSILGPIFVAFLSFFIFVIASLFYYLRPADPKNSSGKIMLTVPNGATFSSVAKMLSEEKAIRSARAFYLAARFPFLVGKSSPFVLKSGFYEISPSMSPAQILKLLDSGRGALIKTAIPEGLTISKIAAILEEDNVCSAKDFKSAAHNPDLLAEYSIPAETFEGFLFPDTYYLSPEMKAEDVVKMMVENFFDHIEKIPFFSKMPKEDFYKALVLASIVEREYRVESEAPLIASVFKNRVEAGVGLYSCATIEYIITEIQGKPHPDIITYDDLKINSPYNTYRWAALPPTPISNPGMVALNAVAESPKTDYFYFTLTDAEAGSHTFSKSFNAHVHAGVQFKTKKSSSKK